MLVIAAIIISIFIGQLLCMHVKLHNSSGILNISPCHLYATVDSRQRSQVSDSDTTLSGVQGPLDAASFLRDTWY